MSKRKIRKFNIDGIEMQFSFSIFNEMFDDKVYRSKRKIGEIEEELAEAVFVEKSTVHTWRYGNSGPSDIEKIQSIAKYFNCEYLNLMTEVNSGDKLMNVKNIGMTESEKAVVNRVYVEMLDLLRTAEKLYDEGLQCEIMKKYDDLPSMDDVDYMWLLNSKLINIEKQVENEMIFISKRTHKYMHELLKILHKLCFIKYFEYKFDDNSNLISYKVKEKEEKETAESFRIIRNMFFGMVKEMLYG